MSCGNIILPNLTTVFRNILTIPLFTIEAMQTGKIGLLVFIANKLAPDFGRKSSPVLERVPSKKIPKAPLFFRIFSAIFNALSSLVFLLIGNTPNFLKKTAKILFLKSSDFAIKRILLLVETANKIESMFDV